MTGLNVAAGYVDDGGGVLAGDPDFVSNPFADTANDHYEVLYRTGDFGRLVGDRLIYEGRKDMQVRYVIDGYIFSSSFPSVFMY